MADKTNYKIEKIDLYEVLQNGQDDIKKKNNSSLKYDFDKILNQLDEIERKILTMRFGLKK